MKKIYKFVLIILLIGIASLKIIPINKYEIITSNYFLKILLESFLPDDITINSLIDKNGNYHNFNPSSNDILVLNNAKYFVFVGEEEPFVDEINETLSKNLEQINISQNVDLLEHDPHFWISPKTTLMVYEYLHKYFSNIYNCADYNLNELKNLDSLYIKKIQEQKIPLIVGHNGLNYLKRDYNMNIISLFGSHDEAMPSTKKTKEIIDIINEQHIQTIFYLQGSSQQQDIKDLAKQTNISCFEIKMPNIASNFENSLQIYQENIDLIGQKLC